VVIFILVFGFLDEKNNVLGNFLHVSKDTGPKFACWDPAGNL
jgi:hypothetical protein